MVVDASALLAVVKAEPQGRSALAQMQAASELLMASVNWTEVLLIVLRIGGSASVVSELVQELGIEIVSVDRALSESAAAARHRYPIRFGDAFVYALAKERNLPILTLDAEFAKTDADLVPLAP